MVKYEFVTEEEIKNCIECPFFRSEVYYCELIYEIKISDDSIPKGCPLQKVEKPKEVKDNNSIVYRCEDCKYEKNPLSSNPCYLCEDVEGKFSNWQPKEIKND